MPCGASRSGKVAPPPPSMQCQPPCVAETGNIAFRYNSGMNLFRPARPLAIAGALTVALFAAEPVVTQAKKQIADKKYDEAITSLEAASKANPKSVEVKNTLVEALLAKADSIMADDAAPPRT